MKKEGADLEEDLVDMLMRQLRSEEQEKGQKAPPIDPLKMYSDSQAFKGLFKTFDQKGIPKLGASDRTVPSATVRRLRQEQRNQAERFLTFQRSVLATLMSRDLTQIFKKNPKMKDKYSEFDSDGIPTKDQFGKKLSDKKRTQPPIRHLVVQFRFGTMCCLLLNPTPYRYVGGVTNVATAQGKQKFKVLQSS